MRSVFRHGLLCDSSIKRSKDIALSLTKAQVPMASPQQQLLPALDDFTNSGIEDVLAIGGAECYICLETLSEPTRILKRVRAPIQQISFALIKYGRNMSSTVAAFSPGSPALPARELVLYVEQL